MELDRLSLDLRRRNGWETLDLGLAMLSAWRAPVMRAWCATYLPFALLVTLVLWPWPGVAGLIVWWAKPLFDRVLLYVYSQAVFGTLPTVRDVWRALPGLVLRTRLLAGLTTYRLSWARTLFLPVWQLEGQRGKAAAARRRVIGKRAGGYAGWLIFFCSNFVMVLSLSLIALAALLMPEGVLGGLSLAEWFNPQQSHPGVARVFNLTVLVAESCVEPYFVAAGFSLYLNRRSELEGWDIEVAFRRMTQRHAAQAVAVVLAACLLCVVLPGAVPQARAQSDAVVADAQPAAPVAYPPHEVKKRIGAILDDPVFGRTETGWRYEYRRGDEEEAKDPAWLARFFKWLRRTVGLFAEGARAIVWVAVASALALAIYLVLRYRERLGFGPTTRHAPQTLFGLDVRPQSLPADIGAAAKELLAAGDVAAALSLLYRGALSALIHFAGVEFRAGDTEGDCWRRVQPVLRGDGLGYFRMLLDAWLWTAYGRRPPRSDELAALCREWPRHFAREALVPPEREAT